MLTITRKLEFDAGHRIPNHKSQCRNIHGHRYVLEITLRGVPICKAGESDEGMVMDFSDIKALANTYLVDLWDHAFLVYEGDAVLCAFLNSLADHKTVILPLIPTVENLAQIAFNILQPVYFAHYNAKNLNNSLELQKITLFETPNCWAEITA